MPNSIFIPGPIFPFSSLYFLCDWITKFFFAYLHIKSINRQFWKKDTWNSVGIFSFLFRTQTKICESQIFGCVNLDINCKFVLPSDQIKKTNTLFTVSISFHFVMTFIWRISKWMLAPSVRALRNDVFLGDKKMHDPIRERSSKWINIDLIKKLALVKAEFFFISKILICNIDLHRK